MSCDIDSSSINSYIAFCTYSNESLHNFSPDFYQVLVLINVETDVKKIKRQDPVEFRYLKQKDFRNKT